MKITFLVHAKIGQLPCMQKWLNCNLTIERMGPWGPYLLFLLFLLSSWDCLTRNWSFLVNDPFNSSMEIPTNFPSKSM